MSQTSKADQPFGVYVHWPFCRAKCPYCDFNSHVRHGGIDEARFLAAYLSKLSHFASLTPVHAIVLFGPETPRLFGSLAPQTTLIWKELACSPCVNVFNHRESPCRNNVCMQMITVDDVDAAVEHALAQRVRQ